MRVTIARDGDGEYYRIEGDPAFQGKRYLSLIDASVAYFQATGKILPLTYHDDKNES